MRGTGTAPALPLRSFPFNEKASECENGAEGRSFYLLFDGGRTRQDVDIGDARLDFAVPLLELWWDFDGVPAEGLRDLYLAAERGVGHGTPSQHEVDGG